MAKASEYSQVATEDDEGASEETLKLLTEDKPEQSGSSDEDVADELGAGDSRETNSRSKHILHAVCGVVLLASFINLALLMSNSSAAWTLYRSGILTSLNSSKSSFTHENGNLKRPNVYIGLDRLPSDVAQAALPDSLVVFPSLFHPIDYRHPDRIFPDDELARFTFNGRVSPVDRHVLLTEEISMVAQFRVQDYGMESCRIISTMPPSTIVDQLDTPFILLGNTGYLQVWNLTTPTAPNSELDVRTLSRSTRPPRGQLLAHFDVQENSTHSSSSFWCGPSGSLQTLEIHCHGTGCHIEFFQSFYFNPRFGIFVSQEPSI